MNKTFGIALSFTLCVSACGDAGQKPEASWPQSVEAQVGQTYELLWTQSTQSGGNSGSTGSSNSKYQIFEKVLEAGPDALVLEYDLAADTSDIDRRREWQFPARVRLTPDNEMTLLNADELKVRNADWLAWGNYNESHCGQWLFTWTAAKIECDPNSVIDSLEILNIRRSNLKAGALYSSPAALKATALKTAPSDSDTTALTATLTLDPELIRRERAETNIIVAQLSRDKVPTSEEALAQLKDEEISGFLKVTYTLDSQGDTIRRVRINEGTIVTADGITETVKSTETVERKPLGADNE